MGCKLETLGRQFLGEMAPVCLISAPGQGSMRPPASLPLPGPVPRPGGVPREPLRGQRKDDEDAQATLSGPWVPGDTVKGPGLREVPSPFQTFKCKARKVIHRWLLGDGVDAGLGEGRAPSRC